MSGLSRTLAVLMACLLAAGCTGAEHSRPARATPGARSGSSAVGNGPTPRPPSASRPLTVAWSNRGVRPVSPPAVVHGIAVFYGNAGKRLYLYGLRASNGRVAWRHPASTSATTQGVDLEVTTVGDLVAYFGPLAKSTGLDARLIAVRPSTGQIVAASVPREWTGTPHPCDDAQHEPCASAFTPQAGTAVQYRLDLHRTGRTVGGLSVVPGVNNAYRDLGEQLVDPGSRQPELIVRRAHGRAVWTRRLHTLFGAKTTTDSGWDFIKYGDYYAGTVYAGLTPRPPGGTLSIDLWHQPVTAGFAADTGGLRWRRRGTAVDCNDTIRGTAQRSVPVRCRYTGTLRYHFPPAGSHRSVRTTTDGFFTAVVEGFDPRTGRTTWSRPLGAVKALFDDAGDPVLAGDTQVVVKTRHDRIVLDTRTGRVTPAPDNGAYWCLQNREFYQAPYDIEGTQHMEIHFGTLPATCNGAGQPAHNTPTFVPTTMSAEFGQLHIVATPRAITAYRGG